MSHYYLITYEAIFHGKTTTANKILAFDTALNKHQIKDMIQEERKTAHPERTGEEIVVIIYRKLTEEEYKSLLADRK
jgi:hypothetical protein